MGDLEEKHITAFGNNIWVWLPVVLVWLSSNSGASSSQLFSIVLELISYDMTLKSIKKNLLHFTEKPHKGLKPVAACAPVLRQLPPTTTGCFSNGCSLFCLCRYSISQVSLHLGNCPNQGQLSQHSPFSSSEMDEQESIFKSQQITGKTKSEMQYRGKKASQLVTEKRCFES